MLYLCSFYNVDILIKGQAPCTQGSIRLQGNTTTSGLVEVCYINVWGTVCDDHDWGIIDAQVACRQLGLPTTGATTLTVSAVPDGTRENWLGYINCVGNESSLFNCSSVLTGNDYCYKSYAGVSCQDSKSNKNVRISQLLSFCQLILFHIVTIEYILWNLQITNTLG